MDFASVLNPISTTRRYKHHQNKVEVKSLGRNSSYLAGFSVFFPWFYENFKSVGKKKRKKKYIKKILYNKN